MQAASKWQTLPGLMRRARWVSLFVVLSAVGYLLLWPSPIDSCSPIASAFEHDGWLYLGSFIREGVARVRLP